MPSRRPWCRWCRSTDRSRPSTRRRCRATRAAGADLQVAWGVSPARPPDHTFLSSTAPFFTCSSRCRRPPRSSGPMPSAGMSSPRRHRSSNTSRRSGATRREARSPARSTCRSARASRSWIARRSGHRLIGDVRPPTPRTDLEVHRRASLPAAGPLLVELDRSGVTRVGHGAHHCLAVGDHDAVRRHVRARRAAVDRAGRGRLRPAGAQPGLRHEVGAGADVLGAGGVGRQTGHRLRRHVRPRATRLQVPICSVAWGGAPPAPPDHTFLSSMVPFWRVFVTVHTTAPPAGTATPLAGT